ncbi:hypothetical protein NIES4072_64910 [Nostoc commune NIES-4072]|uniref:DUF4159 domain-containing protein n=1 Tax=Nostoc commune NIES-4072 TaxID=2005467 RepID=A0A2R5FXI9_NOSCO|nr:DUF4159 domain-containing protein [Nostoc commune]BBD70126.1 hypothetical protein NIES4070_65370 [Nostoc commune HK-02]GBG22779.1 hypothetical protein NIES4072_64910 [Nostoc commune NIES-4072]
MTEQFPLPPIKILERLLVTDGLLMNADRWRVAHEYHRHRQNIHYQSLNQPGIVCGLGVHLISAPAEVPANYRDERWLEVQPGIAIDIAGNPIIVPQPETYRIATQAPLDKSLTVYLVISYVDPERLRRPTNPEIIAETFRIDEKLSPPTETEVELCRIFLKQGEVKLAVEVKLKNPVDVFFPEHNQLDLRYRQQVRSRPQATIRVAQIANSAATKRSAENLSYLVKSVSSLYPNLSAQQIEPINLEIKDIDSQIQTCDLLFLATSAEFSLNPIELAVLKNYLDLGGVLLIDTPSNSNITISSVLDLAKQLGTSLQDIKDIKPNHYLRTEPFLFSSLPVVNQEHIQIQYGEGIILVTGDLSSAWGLNDALLLSRETIRTAQEIGINILHFSWKRRQIMQLLKLENKNSNS